MHKIEVALIAAAGDRGTTLRSIGACMRQKSVLLVEDEESIRESLVELFESEGVETVAAATVAEAQRCLGGRVVDLVVTDIRLGSQRDGGLQVMGAAGILAADAPIIVLTAFPDEDNRLAAQRLGATHFLQKPVDLDIIARIAAAHGIPTALITLPPSVETGTVQ